jgi:hypothetical protein
MMLREFLSAITSYSNLLDTFQKYAIGVSPKFPTFDVYKIVVKWKIRFDVEVSWEYCLECEDRLLGLLTISPLTEEFFITEWKNSPFDFISYARFKEAIILEELKEG